jgi:hypothetical protein
MNVMSAKDLNITIQDYEGRFRDEKGRETVTYMFHNYYLCMCACMQHMSAICHCLASLPRNNIGLINNSLGSMHRRNTINLHK